MLEVYRETWPAHIKALAEKDPQAADAKLFHVGITLLACGLAGITEKNLKEAQFRCAFLGYTGRDPQGAWLDARKGLSEWLGVRGNVTFKDETRAKWIKHQISGLVNEVEYQLRQEAENG